MISTSSKDTIIENNNRISELLKENESVLISEGLNVPEENFTVDKNNRINLPSKYIRVNEAFQTKYHLREIITLSATRKNIAYSLQLTDLYNYFINRFYIWGSVETMLIKSAVITLISVFESLTIECANNICTSPSTCIYINTCQHHFSRIQRNNSFEALKRLNELNITQFNDEELNRIYEIIQLRNRVHIRLAEENEFISADFSISLYNEIIGYIQRLSDYIYENGIVFYNCN